MTAGGIAIALLVLMAIQTLWPIAKEAYIVAHTNFQIAYIPNVRYEQEYLAQAELARQKADLEKFKAGCAITLKEHSDLVLSFDEVINEIKVEHDSLGYYLVYIHNQNMSRRQARILAKLNSKKINNLLPQFGAVPITVRVQENGRKVKQSKKEEVLYNI